MASLRIVEEPGSLSPEEFRERYYLRHRPVILRGAASHWPAVASWSPEYLRRVAAGNRVEVRSKSDYGSDGSKRHFETSRIVDFADVVDMMVQDDSPDLSYARQTSAWADVPALVSDVGHLTCKPDLDKRRGQLWIGPAGTLAQLHWDPQCNLFTQVRGEKRWILVSPADSHLTYPNKFPIAGLLDSPVLRNKLPALVSSLRAARDASTCLRELVDALGTPERELIYAYLAGVNNCDVDAELPDLLRTPRFLGARRHEGTLRAGDAIFVPLCWRHCVRSLSPSVSLNWFFDAEGPRPAELDMRRTLLEHLEL